MYLRSDWFIQELKHLKFRVHIKMVKYIFQWGGTTCDFKSNLRCALIRFWNQAYDLAQIALHSVQLPLFITPIFKSLLVSVIWLALIGAIYSWIAPFFALTHIFFSASEEASLKTKQPIRFQGLLKTTDQIAEKWETTSIMRQILQLLFPKLLSFPPQKWMNLISN